MSSTRVTSKKGQKHLATGVFLALYLFGSLSSAALAENMAPQVKVPATFTLKENTVVDTARIFLDDVATCDGNEGICQEAYGVDLGRAPQPGRKSFLNPLEVEDSLKEEWSGEVIEIEGATSVGIEAKAVTIDPERIEQNLRERLGVLERALAGVRIRLVRFQVPSQKRLRPANYAIEFPGVAEAPEGGERLWRWVRKQLAGPGSLAVLFRPDRSTLSPVESYVSATVALQRKRPVAERTIERGSVITKNDVSLEWTDVSSGINQDYAQTVGEVTGRMARSQLRAGEPISLRRIKIPPVVERGDRVTLLVKRGNLTVTSPVEVTSDAGRGETVTAVYPSSAKRIQARVIDAKTLEYRP